MPILMFVNLKGGVAKTTNVVAVAEALAHLGKRVLVIDADHQCAASELLLGEARANHAEAKLGTLHDLLAEMLKPEPVEFMGYVQRNASDIKPLHERLSVIPCSVRIDDFQTNMAKGRKGFLSAEEFQANWRKHRARLTRWLSSEFDYTLIDCPPSLAVQVRFLLRVADAYLIPSVPDRLSLRGALSLQDRLGKLPSPPPAAGLLWTLYREANEHHRNTVALVAKKIPRLASLPMAFETIVPNAVDIVRALQPEDGRWKAERHQSFPHKYTTKFSKLYQGLAQEIVARASSDVPATTAGRATVVAELQ